MYAQRKFRSACVFAQFDQNLHWANVVYPKMQGFFYTVVSTIISSNIYAKDGKIPSNIRQDMQQKGYGQMDIFFRKVQGGITPKVLIPGPLFLWYSNVSSLPSFTQI